MKTLPSFLTTFLILSVLVPALSIAAADTVQFTSTAEVEVQVLDKNGKKTLVRKPAEVVEPGEIVIYTNIFTNTGEQQIENAVVSTPIPAATTYLGGSATETGYELTFSVDEGKSFAAPDKLFVPDDKGGKRPAEDKDYTNVHWSKQTPLNPGATGVVEFRIRVK